MAPESLVISCFTLCTVRHEMALCLAEMRIPDSWLAAGVVRNTIWDALHQKPDWTPLTDIDVIYHDPTDIKRDREIYIHDELSRRFPRENFSVKNQARMHVKHGHPPYPNSHAAVSCWTETCTAIGIARQEGCWQVLAPYGCADLLDLVVRPTFNSDHYRGLVAGRARSKRWLENWPKLRLLISQD